MARITLPEFDERFPGVQLALFETLWAAEPELTHIHGRIEDGEVQLHFTPVLGPKQESDCIRLAEEVIAVALDGQRPKSTFGQVPIEPGWRTLMSQEVFAQIAKEVAPWRLQRGR